MVEEEDITDNQNTKKVKAQVITEVEEEVVATAAPCLVEEVVDVAVVVEVEEDNKHANLVTTVIINTVTITMAHQKVKNKRLMNRQYQKTKTLYINTLNLLQEITDLTTIISHQELLQWHSQYHRK